MTSRANGRAVVYLRVSSDEQAERGYGLAVQRDRAERARADNSLDAAGGTVQGYDRPPCTIPPGSA